MFSFNFLLFLATYFAYRVSCSARVYINPSEGVMVEDSSSKEISNSSPHLPMELVEMILHNLDNSKDAQNLLAVNDLWRHRIRLPWDMAGDYLAELYLSHEKQELQRIKTSSNFSKELSDINYDDMFSPYQSSANHKNDLIFSESFDLDALPHKRPIWIKPLPLGDHSHLLVKGLDYLYLKREKYLTMTAEGVKLLKMLASFNLLDLLWLKHPDISTLPVMASVQFARHILLCPWVSDWLLETYFFESDHIFQKWRDDERKALRIYMHLRTSFKPVIDQYAFVGSNSNSVAVRYFTLDFMDLQTQQYAEFYVDMVNAFINHGSGKVDFKNTPVSDVWLSISRSLLSNTDPNPRVTVYDGVIDTNDLHIPLHPSFHQDDMPSRAKEMNVISLAQNPTLGSIENLMAFRNLAVGSQLYEALAHLYSGSWSNHFDEQHDFRMLVLLAMETESGEMFFKNRCRGKKKIFLDPFLDILYHRNRTKDVLIPATRESLNLSNIESWNMNSKLQASILYHIANTSCKHALDRDTFKNLEGDKNIVSLILSSVLLDKRDRLEFMVALPPCGTCSDNFVFKYSSLAKEYIAKEDPPVFDFESISDNDTKEKLLHVYIAAGLERQLTDKMIIYVSTHEASFSPILEEMVKYELKNIIIDFEAVTPFVLTVLEKVYGSCSLSLFKAYNELDVDIKSPLVRMGFSARIAHWISTSVVANKCGSPHPIAKYLKEGFEPSEQIPFYLRDFQMYERVQKLLSHAGFLSRLPKKDTFSNLSAIYVKKINNLINSKNFDLNPKMALADFVLFTYTDKRLDLEWFKQVENDNFLFDNYNVIPLINLILKRDDVEMLKILETKYNDGAFNSRNMISSSISNDKDSKKTILDFVVQAFTTLISSNATKILQHYNIIFSIKLDPNIVVKFIDRAENYGRRQLKRILTSIKARQKNVRRIK